MRFEVLTCTCMIVLLEKQITSKLDSCFTLLSDCFQRALSLRLSSIFFHSHMGRYKVPLKNADNNTNVFRDHYLKKKNCRTILGCFLIAKELNSWVWHNASTVSAIAFEQSSKTFSSPYILQPLDCSIVFYTMRILNLR